MSGLLLNSLQGGRFQSLSGHPVLIFEHPHARKVFLCPVRIQFMALVSSCHQAASDLASHFCAFPGGSSRSQEDLLLASS